MKQSMKESLMNGFVGKLVIAAVTLGIAFTGFKVVQPEISTESIEMIFFIVIFILFFGFIFGPILLSEKMQAGVTKEQNKNETEIKKAELENEKIRLQNEQLELQNRQLELQKENQQSLPKNNKKKGVIEI